MKYDFLKDFSKRMKKVGAFTMISYNSLFKTTLKNYGFEGPCETTDLIFAIMLYIMEQSIKEENCTMDDITLFIENLDREYFRLHLTYDDCRDIGDFVVNTVLCNNGEAMYFKSYNFEKGDYEDINISIINNKTIETDDGRRTSYYLTEEGYYMLLSTLEVENNMKLTVQEMIFKLHLERADYDKAIDDVKGLFNLSRIQLQRIEEGIQRIRENVLAFSPEEYDDILNDNIAIIEKQSSNFKGYRDYVINREADLAEKEIDTTSFSREDEIALRNLGIIKKQLSRVIDEHQRILNSHFDFKRVYSDILMDMTAFAAIKRINITRDLYEPILKNIDKLDAMPDILKPLFLKPLPKHYNIKKAAKYQRVIKAAEDDEESDIDFDEESYRLEREEKIRKKFSKYKGVLEILLAYLVESESHSISLEEVLKRLEENEGEREKLIPSLEIFREVMIELLKAETIDIAELKKEAEKNVDGNIIEGFELNNVLLRLILEDNRFHQIKYISSIKDFEEKSLKIYDAYSENGYIKTVKCSNIYFNIGSKKG